MNIPEQEENDLDPRVEHACQELEEILRDRLVDFAVAGNTAEEDTDGLSIDTSHSMEIDDQTAQDELDGAGQYEEGNEIELNDEAPNLDNHNDNNGSINDALASAGNINERKMILNRGFNIAIQSIIRDSLLFDPYIQATAESNSIPEDEKISVNKKGQLV
ncbi:hypothetical protein BGZ46_009328, partial [Entomortierella lignicola]